MTLCLTTNFKQCQGQRISIHGSWVDTDVVIAFYSFSSSSRLVRALLGGTYVYDLMLVIEKHSHSFVSQWHLGRTIVSNEIMWLYLCLRKISRYTSWTHLSVPIWRNCIVSNRIQAIYPYARPFKTLRLSLSETLVCLGRWDHWHLRRIAINHPSRQISH